MPATVTSLPTELHARNADWCFSIYTDLDMEKDICHAISIASTLPINNPASHLNLSLVKISMGTEATAKKTAIPIIISFNV